MLDPSLDRRALLGAALATAALSGCTDQPVAAGHDSDDHDAAIAAGALAAVDEMVERLRAAGAQPRPARLLAPTLAVHVEHRDLLAEAVTDDTSASPTPGTSRTPPPSETGSVFAELSRAEERLGQTLRAGAFRAQSGPFARVLASMAAAAAQQAVVLRRLG